MAIRSFGVGSSGAARTRRRPGAAGARAAGQFPCFDGVRAIAALMVIVYHAVFFSTWFKTPGGTFLWNLNAGVWIFFVTSGFLLYRPFVGARLASGSAVGVRGYAVRRIARIYPAYWAVLAFFTFIVPRAQINGFGGFLRHVTLTQTYSQIRNPFLEGLPPAWSLVVEVTFYAFLPVYSLVIGRIATGRRRPLRTELVGVVCLLVFGLSAIVAIAAGYDAPWILVLPQHLAAFALGMFLAILSMQPWDRDIAERLARIGRPAGLWWGLAAVVFIAIPLVLRIEPFKTPNAGQEVGLNVAQTMIGFFVVVPAVLGAQDAGWIRRTLHSRVLVYLGLVSYGLYLWHWWILRMVQEDWLGWGLGGGNWVGLLALALPLIILAASLSWYLVERPVLRLARPARAHARTRARWAAGDRKRVASRPLSVLQSESNKPAPVDEPAPEARPRLNLAVVAEWAVYAVAVALVTWPAFTHGGHEILGSGDDARYYTWLGWRIGRLIGHWNLAPVRITDAIYPFGFDLRLIDGYLPSYVSGLFNLFVGPIRAVNLAYVTGAILNVLAARSLARRCSPRRVVHVIAAVAFLTAPPIALNVQLGLLPLFWAFTVPLLIGDAIDIALEKRRVRPVRLTLLLVAAYLCSVYFLVFGGLAYGLIVGVAVLRRREWRIPLRVAAAVAATVLLLLPFLDARVKFNGAEERHGANTLLLADSKVFSADALSIVAQPTRSTFLIPRPTILYDSIVRLPGPDYELETTIFPGLILLIGFSVFMFVRSRLRLPLALAAGVTWVLCLGPSLKVGGNFVWEHAGGGVSRLPYRLLLAFPALGALRVPDRAGEVLVVVLVAATAITLDHHLASGGSRKLVVVSVGSACLLATNLLLPMATTTTGTTRASERAMREIGRLARPGDTVLRVPSDCDASFVSYQIFHRAPVVGCAGSFAANPFRAKEVAYTRSSAITKLRCDRGIYGNIPTKNTEMPPLDKADLAQLRKAFGVRFLVVDRSLIGEGCLAIKAVKKSLAFLERYRSLGGDNRFEVLDLDPPAGR